MRNFSFQLTPAWRRVVMQAVLVLVLSGAVGLAWVVTRHVNSAMRVELRKPQSFGRLSVRLPAGWNASEKVSVDKGDGVEVEEPVPAGDGPGGKAAAVAGRRIRVLRQRAVGLIAPLEHLHRSGRISAGQLRALADGREGTMRESVSVAQWPGQMVSYTTTPRPGVVHKDVIACAVMAGGQAVVVQLQGVGPVDASDRAIVRQVCETASVTMVGAPAPAARDIELSDGITLPAPPGYVSVGAGDDPNNLQRQLIFDSSTGAAPGWVAIDLAACVFFPDDGEDLLLAMLHARDPDWRSGRVQRLGPRTLMVERIEQAGGVMAPSVAGAGIAGPLFPARAYLVGNDDGRAVLIVLRGGLRDGRMFDAAWTAIGSGVRFAGRKDLSALVANGRSAVRAIAERGLVEAAGSNGNWAWNVWDQAENAGEEEWQIFRWKAATKEVGAANTAIADAQSADRDAPLTGQRSARSVEPYGQDVRFEQTWSASADLSKYEAETFRETRRENGPAPRRAWEQRVVVDRNRLTLSSTAGTADSTALTTPASASPGGVATPVNFLPGAVLPLVLRDIAEKPCLIKTESFVGLRTAAGPGLLTLFVTRLTSAPIRQDEDGAPMDCVSVSVNGTGEVSRWYYGKDEDGRDVLRFIDFAGGVKAVGREVRK